ncbi:MAG TPA: hypothetical protein VFV11_05525 [Solimonas sp.]|nr:hypothetical protein [Solimonas sp.]
MSCPSRRSAARRPWLATAALALPGLAEAHGFGQLYNLPVPFWLYAWAATAALVLSFVVAAFFATRTAADTAPAPRDLPRLQAALRRLAPGLKLLSVGFLLLAIASGLLGSRDPYRNFSMTAFWVVFVLAFSYLTALVGNAYAVLNPWRVLADTLGRGWRGYTAGRWRYPARLGDWPALALYLAFIAYELFNHGRPSSLGTVLLGYSLLNLVGVWAVGAAAWFRHVEFFSLFLRLTALMSPLHYRPAGPGEAHGQLAWRAPFAGLLAERPEHLGTVVFVLAMLATTAFDGLRATQWWVGIFWFDPMGWVTALADGAKPLFAYPKLRPWYLAWEMGWLLLLPFLYFAAFVLFVAVGKLLTLSRRPLRELVLDFAYTVLPIVLVYHLTHYATLVLTQGPKILSLLSDPFGWGWNLFGTAGLWRAPILPPMGWVWHTQVGLILFGHIVSVVLAHRVALRLWPQRWQALLSQLPMLLLMVAFTVAGLWILAQPLTAVLLR